jgi:methylated-DNA-[protein]-cysteine S-methyltransferase
MTEQSFPEEIHSAIGTRAGGKDDPERICALDPEVIGGRAAQLLRRPRAETSEYRSEVAVRSANSRLKKKHFYKIVKSPVGALKLVASEAGLAAILWENDDPRRVRLNIVAEDKGHAVLLETERQLKEYFDGRRKSFQLRLDFAGTRFQSRVWSALLEIPFGETRSYAEIARRIGSPKAVRAVGAANGRNPISIVAPCHRVIGSNGKLTGFAGGLTIKAFLLGLEGARTPTI